MATQTVVSDAEVTGTGPDKDSVIVVENLWKTYDMGSEQQVHALRGVNLTNMSPSWDRQAPANPR